LDVDVGGPRGRNVRKFEGVGSEGGTQIMSEVEIIVDGSCLGNPGPGGCACILRFGDDERALHGGTPETTNNRMELSGAIEGLRALNRACRVTVLTDSEYLRRGITKFLPRWKENDWRNSAGKANQDLWEQLEELVQTR
jgi:ribonuclease HI